MNKLLPILLLLLTHLSYGQVSNNGALISVKSGAMMSVHDDVVNYNGGEFHNTDTIYLFENWINNAGNEAFISQGVGIVHMYGGTQRIQGTDITRFYDLRMEQTGIKYGDLDVYVDGFLRLNDRRFHMDTNCVTVFNPQLISVENFGDGYVSALSDGGLLRYTNSQQPYFYPVGWPGYYRPLELEMSSLSSNQMKVRMAFDDATNEGFDRNLREPTLCEVIPTFFHKIHQVGGTDSARVKIHYDPAVDGIWNTIAHFQNAPQWEDTGDQDAGVDSYTGLDYFNTIAFNTNFNDPAFALANSSDILSLVADDTIICEGQVVTFTAESGYLTYEFFVNGVSVQSGASNTYVTSDLMTNDTITFEATDADCIYQSTEIVMTVLPLPTPTASSNSPACELGVLELFADGGDTYEWSGPNGFSSLDQNPVLPNPGLGGAGTYIVTVTNNLACSATASTEVVILPAPTPTASTNAPICIGNDLNLLSDGGISYEWSGPNGFSSTDQNPIIINPPTSNSGTYTVTVTDSNGCTNSTTVEVVINDLPTPTATNDGPVCLGGDITLSATGGTSYEWSGPESFTSNLQSPVLTSPSLLMNGTYTVTVTDDNGCSATAETIVTIFDLPTPLASSNSPVCDNGILMLSADGGTTYEWSGPNAFTSNNQNPTINPVSLLAAGTYTVTVTDANGCTNIATTDVTIFELPVVSIGSNSPVCVNETINLNANGGVSYEWSGPDGFVSQNQNPSIPNAVLGNGGTYSVTITDANGCTNIGSTDVIVNDLPTPTASNDSPVCLGEDVNLSSSGGTTYEWSGPDGFTSSDQNPILTAPSLLANGVYTVTVTDGNGCTATTETTVIINDLPVVEVSSNSPVCNGNILTLAANGGVDYQWTGPNGFTSNQQNPTIDPVDLLATGTYTVVVTDVNGCVNMNTTEVVIYELPTVLVGSNSPVCLLTSIDLNANGGVSYEWTGPNSFTSNLQNPSIPSADLIHAGTYTVVVTDANGCMNSNTTEVVVLPLPNPTATNDGPQCIGSDIQLFVDDGVSFSWDNANGYSSTEQNPILTDVTQADQGIYTVTVTDVNGCTNTASTTVFVFDPVIESAMDDSPACLGEMVQMSVTGDASWNYQWSGPNGFSSTEQNPSFLGDEVEDSGTYTVTVTDNNGCTGVFQTIVVVSDFPNLETTINSSPICEFSSVQLETSFDPNWDYDWTGPNGFIDSIHNPLVESVSFENEGDYIVTVTNAAGCETIDTVNLDVHDDLGATSYGDTLIYEGQSAVIGVTDGIDFIWLPSGSLDCSDCPEAVAMPESTTIYEVVVVDEYGCLDTFSITVEVEVRTDEDLVVPNTITPNGDGKNDTWIIPWLDRFPDNEVVILNRYGDEVFKDKPYQNDFDGEYEGRELPPGTYYFILLLGEDFRPFKGPLTILRD